MLEQVKARELEQAFKQRGGYRRDLDTLVIKMDDAVEVALQAKEAGRAEERERVVAWLRDRIDGAGSDDLPPTWILNHIAAGSHIPVSEHVAEGEGRTG